VALALLAAQVRELTVWIEHLALRTVTLNSGAGASAPQPSAPAEPIATMDDRRLRNHVVVLAHSMCDFEHTFQSDELQRRLSHPPVAGSPADIQRQWQTEAGLWQQRYGDYENEFRKQFLGDALAYRAELLRRLKTTPPDEERQIPALHGNLTGASPVCDLGVYLQSLAAALAP
jgi:hypothetical protein